MIKTLAVIGQGYVGLPVAMRAVGAGYRVIGLDLDRARVTALSSGSSYVGDISDTTLQDALASGQYLVTDDYADLAGFDVAVITVPTPLAEGLPNLSFIEDAGRAVAPYVRRSVTVILESTTYPGTTEELLAPILQGGSGLRPGVDFHLGYSPERIDPGNPTYNFVNTPKVVSGISPASLEAVQGFYDTLIGKTIPVGSCKAAELTKLLENTFRHVNIALVNELAVFAHDLDINIWEAIEASSTKPFGFMPFSPGPGVGGHCLPIDPSYLSWQIKRRLGTPFRFVELANDINDHMPDYVVRRIGAMLNERAKAVNGSRILLLGIAYKKNSGDARESPAVRVAELLVALGAQVGVADPHVAQGYAPGGTRRTTLTVDEVRSADLVVVLTDHDAFDYDLLAAATAVFDTRNRQLPVARVL